MYPKASLGTNGAPATVELGQPSATAFTSNTANNGGISASSLSGPTGPAFDSAGNLWVADQFNHRVLMYPKASLGTNGAPATVELGQPSATAFTSNTANNGGISASSASNPNGPAFDSTGNLWVTDQFNNRVLMYPKASLGTNGAPATVELGQPSATAFTSASAPDPPTASSLNSPVGNAFDLTGNLWVADLSNNRVLMYPKASLGTNGAPATVELGQPSATAFTSNIGDNGGISASSLFVPLSPAFDLTGNLWLADFANHRVLEYVPTTSGIQTTGQVTVLPTCGISLTSGAPINYGSLVPSSTSAEQTLILHNTGSVAATLSVHGTDWLDGVSNSQMLVGNTKFSVTSGTYASKTALTSTDQTVGTINPTPNLSTFWQLQANLVSSTFQGALTQTVTFSNSC
jgi:hypothetical protein